MAKKTKSFRFDEKTIYNLEQLSILLKVSSTSLVEGLINIEFDKIQGDPKLLRVIDQMNRLKEVMQNYQHVVFNDNPEGVIDWNDFAKKQQRPVKRAPAATVISNKK